MAEPRSPATAKETFGSSSAIKKRPLQQQHCGEGWEEMEWEGQQQRKSQPWQQLRPQRVRYSDSEEEAQHLQSRRQQQQLLQQAESVLGPFGQEQAPHTGQQLAAQPPGVPATAAPAAPAAAAAAAEEDTGRQHSLEVMARLIVMLRSATRGGAGSAPVSPETVRSRALQREDACSSRSSHSAVQEEEEGSPTLSQHSMPQVPSLPQPEAASKQQPRASPSLAGLACTAQQLPSTANSTVPEGLAQAGGGSGAGASAVGGFLLGLGDSTHSREGEGLPPWMAQAPQLLPNSQPAPYTPSLSTVQHSSRLHSGIRAAAATEADLAAWARAGVDVGGAGHTGNGIIQLKSRSQEEQQEAEVPTARVHGVSSRCDDVEHRHRSEGVQHAKLAYQAQRAQRQLPSYMLQWSEELHAPRYEEGRRRPLGQGTAAAGLGWGQQNLDVAAFQQQHGRLPRLLGSISEPLLHHEGRLPAWCALQRQRYQGWCSPPLPPEQVAALEAIRGWCWEQWWQQDWEQHYPQVVAFQQLHGRLPRTNACSSLPLVADEEQLGRWCTTQRQRYRGNSHQPLTPGQVAALAAIPGWEQQQQQQEWEQQCQRLAAFQQQHGRLPRKPRRPDNNPQPCEEIEEQLWTWCDKQRQRWKGKRQPPLSPEQVTALAAIPGWNWAPRPRWERREQWEQWEQLCQRLAAFQHQHGRLPRCNHSSS